MKKQSFLILLGCLLLFISGCGQAPQKAEIGAPAPNFTLMDRQGQTWTLSELKGQVVFLNFWATWCPPCVEEMPSMQALHAMLPKDKFKMLTMLTGDVPALADLFAKKNNLTMPILYDQDKTINTAYGVTGLPETFIIDKQGILREKFIGPAQWDSPSHIQMIMKYIN